MKIWVMNDGFNHWAISSADDDDDNDNDDDDDDDDGDMMTGMTMMISTSH